MRMILRSILFLVPLFIGVNTCYAQNFTPDLNGYVAGPEFLKFIQQRGYKLVSLFDTIHKNPLLIAAQVMKDEKWLTIDTRGHIIDMDYFKSLKPDGQSSFLTGGFEAGKKMPPADKSTFGIVILNGKYGTEDLKTKKLGLPAIYDKLEYAGEAVITFSGGKYGLASRDGKVLAEPKYDQIESRIYNGRSTNDLFFVKSGAKFGIMSIQGVELISPQYDQLVEFEGSGKGADLIRIRDNKKWGFADKNGKVILKPIYDQIKPYYGIIQLSIGSKKGYLSADGLTPFDPVYTSIDFQYQMGHTFYLTTKEVNNSRQYGVLDKNAKMLLKPLYDKIKFENGLFIVKMNDKSGAFDLNGIEILSPVFDELYTENQILIIKKEKQWLKLDRKSKIKSNLNFDNITHNNDFFGVNLNNKWGAINLDGKLILPVKYDRVTNSTKFRKRGLIEVQLSDHQYTIDRYGNQYLVQ